MKRILVAILSLVAVVIIAGELPEEAENTTPAFKIQGCKYAAQIYSYSKTANLMIKLSLTADTSLCTPTEFGYFMGSLESTLLPTVISEYYTKAYGEEEAAQLDLSDMQSMRTPFEKPKMEISLEMTENGVSYTLLTRASGQEVSVKQSTTWKELYESE